MTFYHSHIPTFAKNKLVCNMRTIIFKKQTRTELVFTTDYYSIFYR